MMKHIHHPVWSFLIISGAFFSVMPGQGQDIPRTIYSNEQQAINAAKSEGKLILADIGRPGCSDCSLMEGNFDADRVRQRLMASCIMWSTNFDNSIVWERYITASVVDLPVWAFIDPYTMERSIWTGLGAVTEATVLQQVNTRLLNNLPLAVTNLPVSVLLTNFCTLKGTARTNAALSCTITNSPIDSVMCRLNSEGEFQPANAVTPTWGKWSADVRLAHRTNVFESYVKYQAGNSWTNRVQLVYDVLEVKDFVRKPGKVEFTMLTGSNTVALQYSANLKDWSTLLTTNISTTDVTAATRISLASTNSSGFYRLLRQN